MFCDGLHKPQWIQNFAPWMLLTAFFSEPFNCQTLLLYSINGCFFRGKTWHKIKHQSFKSFIRISTSAIIDNATVLGSDCSSHKSFEPMSRITTLGAVTWMSCKSCLSVCPLFFPRFWLFWWYTYFLDQMCANSDPLLGYVQWIRSFFERRNGPLTKHMACEPSSHTARFTAWKRIHLSKEQCLYLTCLASALQIRGSLFQKSSGQIPHKSCSTCKKLRTACKARVFGKRGQ